MGYGYEAPAGRQAFRLLATVTYKELRDDKRSLLLTIRALNLIWYRAGLPTCGRQGYPYR